MKVELVKELLPNSTEAMRMFNIVFKRCLNKGKFEEFGRDRAYYNFEKLERLPQYKLNIASGYKASMDLYHGKLLLCTELAFKLLNSETVWDTMQRFYTNDHASYKETCFNHLVGQTVITKYLSLISISILVSINHFFLLIIATTTRHTK